MIKPEYKVRRIKLQTNPHYLVEGYTIVKIVAHSKTNKPKLGGWYVGGHLFSTLRDAIIWCVYKKGA